MTEDFVERVSGAIADVIGGLRGAFSDIALVDRATRRFLEPDGSPGIKSRVSAVVDKGPVNEKTDLSAFFNADRAQRKRFSSENAERDAVIAITTDNRVASQYANAAVDAVYRSIRGLFNDRDVASARIYAFATKEFSRLDKEIAGSDGTVLAIYEGFAGTMAMAAVEAVASVTFTTADEVQAARETLIRQYEAITGYGIGPETAEEAGNAFHEALQYLEGLDLQLPRLQDIELSDVPSSVLAYQLYGSTERQEALLDLNPTQSPVLFERRVTVLQDA